MKFIKRNAVIIAVVVFVALAVYLNWSYGAGEREALKLGADKKQNEITDTSDTSDNDEKMGAADGESDGAGLFYSEQSQSATSISEYFDEVRLARKQARDKASETLQSVSVSTGATQETMDAALQELMKLADRTVAEQELEAQIIAKGFADCVVFMNDTGVTVTVAVPMEGLSTAGAARITDVITTNTEYDATQLKIVEIK